MFINKEKTKKEINKEINEIFSAILKKEIEDKKKETKDKKFSLKNLCDEYTNLYIYEDKNKKIYTFIEKSTIENYYYEIRKGITPEIKTLFQLSKLFHTNIEYLLGLTDDKNEYISEDICFQNFFNNFKNLVDKRKITLKKLSSDLKICYKTLRTYIKLKSDTDNTNKYYKIPLINIGKISEYFEVSISELFDLKIK